MDFEQVVKAKCDSELLRMVYEFDKWNVDMLRAVEMELNNRGKLPTDIGLKREESIADEHSRLSNARSSSLFGRILGWLTIFGIGGIFIGYNYAFGSIRSRYTEKVYPKYDEATRDMGKNMFYLSILLTSLAVGYKILTLE